MTICNANDVERAITLDPRDAIDIVEGSNIKVDKDVQSTKTVYTISYVEEILASVITTVSEGITKVGTVLASVDFTGNIVEGTNNIVTREMVPDKGLDLTAPFAWNEIDVVGNTPGLFPQFNDSPTKVSILDSEGNTIEKEIGVDFRHLFYVGFSIKDTITEADIKLFSRQDLLKGILDLYKTYTYLDNTIPVYIYWVFPFDTTGFTYATEGPLPVPLKLDMSNVDILDSGITKSYRVIRTSTKSRFDNAIITLS